MQTKFTFAIWSILALSLGVGVAYSVFLEGNYGYRVAYNLISKVRPIISLASTSTAPTLLATTTEDQALGSDDADNQEMADLGNLSDDGTYDYKVSSSTIIQTSAESYLVGDMDTGQVLLSKNPDFKSPMASVTKLMTALVTEQNLDMRQYTTVSKTAYDTFGAEGELQVGEKMLVGDLLYPLLIESSNDAAEVLAEYYGRSAFMQKLNEEAGSLGMTSTYYDDPSGLSPQNVTTVSDLFKLAQYVRTAEPSIFDITRIRQYSILHHTWINQNYQLNYDTFVGGKNGYIDEAKKTTVSLFALPLSKTETRTIAIILLKSDDREGDIRKILNYVQKNITYTPKLQNDLNKNASTTPASDNPDE